RGRVCNPSTTATCSAVPPPTSGCNSATPCRPSWPKRSPAASGGHWRGADSVSAHSKNGAIAFQPRARLLKLIGEELISDEVVAVSELVKNSHDADAGTVSVTFRSVTSEGGTIEVCDDGVGMDVATLLGRWMEPAASTKVGKGRQITPKGRRVLGE